MMEVETKPQEIRIRWWIPLLICAGLLIFGFHSLDRYSVNWDEALGDFFFGERYLSYFLSWDEVYLDFTADPYPPDHRPDLRSSRFRMVPWEYPPVAATLGALTSAIFSPTLGWLDPFDGYHALNLLLAVLLVAALFPFLAERFGQVAATAGLVFLFTSPRVFSHLMANIKDFPSMVFFSLTVVVFLRAWERGSWGDLLVAGCVAGLALGTRANALFLAPILLATLVLGGMPEVWRGRRRQLGMALVGAAVLAVVVLIAVWPYLWADPFGRLQQHYAFLASRKAGTSTQSAAPVLQALLTTTPPAFLAFFAVGLVPVGRQALRRDRAAILVLVWIAVVLGRYALPMAVNYDGVRHLLEIFPPMAAVAGAGVAWAGKGLAERLARVSTASPRLLRVAFLVLALVPGTRAVLASHPHQLAYWNIFVGGYAGAWQKSLPQAGDYWALSYRLGIEWLNENAPEGSLLVVPVAEHTVRLVAPEWLRGDILPLSVSTPFSRRIDPERLRFAREAGLSRPVYVMFVDRRDWINEIMVDCMVNLEPEVTFDYDGVPVLRVYRYRLDRELWTPSPGLR